MTTLQERSLKRLTNQDRQVALAFLNKVQQCFPGQLISVTMFGSRARGEAVSDSDMDLLVVLANVNPEIRKTVHHLAAEVWLEYGIFLSTLVWSQDHWRKVQEIRTSLYQDICRDGIDLSPLAASMV
jgi:predicted nucleotidyltransferase